MQEKFLNQEVLILKKDGTETTGIIKYWIQEYGEREYILINSECIYVDEIKYIELISEKEFINNFNKDVFITLKDGTTVEGHCETFTRSIDSDYDEPELTIATSKGYVVVNYSEVKNIEIIKKDNNESSE